MPSKKKIKSREYLPLIYSNAEDVVMNDCWYCNKCENCSKFQEVKKKFHHKGFFDKNKHIPCWEVIYRDKNKHFKIKVSD